ncbi:MAG: YjbE family putative metal transport protein [Pseudomonadota bacterium]
MALVTASELSALGAVLLIDLVLAGDNTIVIGLAVAGLPPALRRRAIIFGVAAATGLRIGFAAVVLHLMAIVGLTLAGGLLLLWVAWKMWRELRAHRAAPAGAAVVKPKTLGQAALQIVIADISMSLDNVLAVAGAAGEHAWVLVAGLVISVGLTGLASAVIANLLNKYPWIAYAGLAVIAYVAGDMIWRGAHDVVSAL